MVEAVTATAFATITTDTATRPPLWAVRELWLAARSRYVCDSHDNDDEYLNTLLIRMVNGKFNEFRILCAIIACDAPSSYRLWITLNFHSLSHVFSCVRTPALSKWAPFPNKNIQIAALLLKYIYLFFQIDRRAYGTVRNHATNFAFVLSSVQFFFGANSV